MGVCERCSTLLAFPFLRSVNHLNWNNAASSSLIVQCAIGVEEALLFSTYLIRFGSECFPSLCQILSALLESPFPFFLKPCMGYPLQPSENIWLFGFSVHTSRPTAILSWWKVKLFQILEITTFKQEVACCIWKLVCLNLLHGICILKTNICLWNVMLLKAI